MNYFKPGRGAAETHPDSGPRPSSPRLMETHLGSSKRPHSPKPLETHPDSGPRPSSPRLMETHPGSSERPHSPKPEETHPGSSISPDTHSDSSSIKSVSPEVSPNLSFVTFSDTSSKELQNDRDQKARRDMIANQAQLNRKDDQTIHTQYGSYKITGKPTRVPLRRETFPR